MVQPRECFLDGSQYPQGHLFLRVFTFVDFGEYASMFLKACGVKAKPDFSDIVRVITKDPRGPVVKTNAGGEGPEKYLNDLRMVAVEYEGFSKENKEIVSDAPIFVGYHISGSPDSNQSATSGKDEFQLVKASEVLIADDLENRRIFGELVWLAPQDELLEKLYESVGAGHLSNHIKYTVKPISPIRKNHWTRPEEVREAIVEKLPIFLHAFDKQRLKNPSLHLSWAQQSRFLVKGCKNLNVGKRLDPDYCVAHGCRGDNFEFRVSAEITADADSPVTLWLKKEEHVDMYE
ncbi:hypothetical protein M405DRAFT_846050 [Rhizopogon salebrosus TDB-379]|nr:hypothetical protein M405DRAFT_846050 [Rhizopogon salebrosus TDB-379]